MSSTRQRACQAQSPATCRCKYLYHWEDRYELEKREATTPEAKAAASQKLEEVFAAREARKARQQLFFRQEVTLDFKHLNDATDDFFAHGNCFLFALALAERTGGELIVWDTDQSGEFDWSGHAAVKVDGAYLDVTGSFTEADLAERYSTPLKQQTFASHRELMKHCVYWDFYIDEPWNAAGEVAHKLTGRYVDLVLKQRV